MTRDIQTKPIVYINLVCISDLLSFFLRKLIVLFQGDTTRSYYLLPICLLPQPPSPSPHFRHHIFRLKKVKYQKHLAFRERKPLRRNESVCDKNTHMFYSLDSNLWAITLTVISKFWMNSGFNLSNRASLILKIYYSVDTNSYFEEECARFVWL